MLRALATLLKDSLMPAGFLQKDLDVGPNNETLFLETKPVSVIREHSEQELDNIEAVNLRPIQAMPQLCI